MSGEPDLRQEVIALSEFFKETRKLTVPEAVDVMLNTIPYVLGFDRPEIRKQIRFAVTRFDPTEEPSG